MSLIGDALKKARADKGSGSGLPPNVFAAPAPRRSNLPWIVAAAAISLAIGVLVGAALFYRAIPTAAETATATATDTATIPLPSVQAGDGPNPLQPTGPQESESHNLVSGGLPSQESIAPAGAPPSRIEPATESASLLPGASQGDRVDAGAVTGEASATKAQTQLSQAEAVQAAESVPKPAKPAATPGRAPNARDGESFVREVRLADGRTLNLTGIVWSDASPAALINGEVFSVGEGDGPWTVAELQRGEVTIESDGLRFSLRLK